MAPVLIILQRLKRTIFDLTNQQWFSGFLTTANWPINCGITANCDEK